MDPALARYRRVQAAMARHGVGALCLATPHLGAFASGARRVRVAGSGGTVPWVVVAAGAPSAVVFTPDPDGAPAWMPRDAVQPLAWDRDRQLARIAAVVAPTTGSVACDVASPALRAALRGRALVDALPLLAAAAAPRSDAEIAAIGRALAAARACVRAAAAAVAPGARRTALDAAFAGAMAAGGAGFPLHELDVRRGRVALDADAVLDDGDVLAIAGGVWVGGHAGVAGVTVACGAVDLAAPRRAWSEALCAVASCCRDGASGGELRAAAGGAGAGRLVVHGLGVGIEPPVVDGAGGDDERLRAGTVLVVGPELEEFRATRALLVGVDGFRWIEPAP